MMTYLYRRAIRLAACIPIALLSYLLLMAPPAKAQGTLLAPDATLAGKSQYAWSQEWWKTMMALPADSNPILDTTGVFAAQGDKGQVFLLAGSGDSGPVVRNVTVQSNQYLFFPLLNGVDWAAISAYGGGLTNMQRDVAEFFGLNAQGDAPQATFFAQLNGSDLTLPPSTPSLQAFRQASPDTYELFVTDNNIFGAAGSAPGTFSAISDGWWGALAPLTPGNYTLHYGGSVQGYGAYEGSLFSQDLTYHLTVVATPEPGSVALFAAGCLVSGTGWIVRRRKGMATI